MNPVLFVLVGMIASGKSTFCKRLAQTTDVVIVNDDAIVTAVHGGYTRYHRELKPLYKAVEEQIAIHALALRRSVLVDRGVNVHATARRRWIGLAHSRDVECHAIVFPRLNPELHAQRRFASDARGHTEAYWLEVAKSHDATYELPTKHEGFDEVLLVAGA